MERSKPKIIPRKSLNSERLTWTEPFFPTGETPSPKNDGLFRDGYSQTER